MCVQNIRCFMTKTCNYKNSLCKFYYQFKLLIATSKVTNKKIDNRGNDMESKLYTKKEINTKEDSDRKIEQQK